MNLMAYEWINGIIDLVRIDWYQFNGVLMQINCGQNVNRYS